MQDREPPARGVFITLEGGEGAGKSTQVTRLAARIRARTGRPVVVTREPGGSTRAEEIRTAILSGVAKPYGPFAEALLFSAARLDHLDTRIRPALARGETVICDRFIDSTRAYQGAAGGLDPAVLTALERVIVGPTKPALTLMLDLPPEIGLARASARGEANGEGPDRFEAEALSFHTRLRSAFLDIAAREPQRCAVIDASASPEEVEAAITAVVGARFPSLIATGEGADGR